MKKIQILLFLTFLKCVIDEENFVLLEDDIPIEQNFNTKTPDIDDIIKQWKSSEYALGHIVKNALKFITPVTLDFATKSNISTQCKSSVSQLLTGLAKNQYWAFQMIDASGMLPNGLMGGAISSLGDYDSCLEVVEPNNLFKGKYCPVTVSVPLPERQIFQPLDDPKVNDITKNVEPGSVIYHLSKHLCYLYITKFRTSICIPSTCSRVEVESFIKQISHRGKFSLMIEVPYCEEKQDSVTFTSREVSIIILFCALFALVVFGTVTDVIIALKADAKSKAFSTKVILCFSAYTNLKNLMKTKSSPHSIDIFYGLKVISIFWIILGHTYIIVNFHSHDGYAYKKDIAKGFWFQVVMNGFLAVETFFFISAVLLSYTLLRRPRKINILQVFLIRYWRLTPTLMLVTYFFNIAEHIGSGPIWKDTVTDKLSGKCKKRGWLNFFYISNIFETQDTCMSWTWYLSVDMQLFLISLIVLIVIQRNVRRGMFLIGFLMLCGMCATAFVHIYYKLPPTYLQSYLDIELWIFYASKAYRPFFIHLAVCCIGLVTGYILARRSIYVSKNCNIFGWIISLMVILITPFSTYYWNQGAEYIPGPIVSALYASTYRIFWAFALAFITISCKSGNGGVFTKILDWKCFAVLGKLTYVVFLIHYGIIYLYTGSARTTTAFSHRTMMFEYFGNVTISFMTSCILTLFIESPFMALDKLLLRRFMEEDLEPNTIANGTYKKKKDCL